MGWMLKLGAAVIALMPTYASAETVYIHAGRVITSAANAPLGASTIRVDNDKIISIMSGHQVAPAGVRVINLADKTVLPGLIDLHVHLSGDPGGDYRDEAVLPDEWGVVVGTKNARITAMAGFTTVRDLGSAPNVGFVLRDGTAKGIIAGPRIVSAGTSISIVGGHGDVSGFRREVNAVLDGRNTCTGAQECAQRVREASKNGADVIKITATGGVLSQQGRGLGQHFTDAEMSAIVDTAKSLGLRVAAHAHGARGIEGAARAGVDTIEHGTFGDDAALKVMKQNNVLMVPTLMALAGVAERLGKGIYTPTVETKIRQTMTQMGKSMNAAKQMGVPIGFGTDAGVFAHGRNAEELGMMVKYGGMTNREVLASATLTAARYMDLEGQIGQIAPGFSADIIAVKDDPLTNIRTLEKVDFVMVRGRVIQ